MARRAKRTILLFVAGSVLVLWPTPATACVLGLRNETLPCKLGRHAAVPSISRREDFDLEVKTVNGGASERTHRPTAAAGEDDRTEAELARVIIPDGEPSGDLTAPPASANPGQKPRHPNPRRRFLLCLATCLTSRGVGVSIVSVFGCGTACAIGAVAPCAICVGVHATLLNLCGSLCAVYAD